MSPSLCEGTDKAIEINLNLDKSPEPSANKSLS